MEQTLRSRHGIEIIFLYSNTELRRKGLRRHWDTIHKDLPFPKDRHSVGEVVNVVAPSSSGRIL
jgi:hypothetical protein